MCQHITGFGTPHLRTVLPHATEHRQHTTSANLIKTHAVTNAENLTFTFTLATSTPPTPSILVMGLSLSCVIGTTRCMALFVLFLMVSNASAGEWVDLSKELGWSTFKNGRPFDFRDNLRYCNKTYTKLSNSDTNESWHVKIHKELRKLQKRGGGTLLLGYGTYYLSAQVKLPSYTCLIGRGMNQTILKLVDNATTFKQAGMVRSKHTERVTIARLTIDGNRAKQNSTDIYKGAYGRFGIFTHLTNYLYIYQVRARNQAGYGMDPHVSERTVY